MKMNWKIGILVLSVFLAIIGIWLWKIKFQNREQEIQNQKLKIENEIPIPQEKQIQERKVEVNKVNEIAVEVEAEEEVEPTITDFTPVYQLSEEERYIITCIVAGEAGGEIYKGKMAVAQCILDNTTYEKSGIADVRWKFDGWNTKLETKNPEMWAECVSAVSEVFDNGERVSDELLLWFYNRDKMYSSFHEKQKWICKIGNHDFFGLK